MDCAKCDGDYAPRFLLACENENEIEAPVSKEIISLIKATSPEEYERAKSVVISGVPESTDNSLANRNSTDCRSFFKICDDLKIEAIPQFVYRIGSKKEDDHKFCRSCLRDSVNSTKLAFPQPGDEFKLKVPCAVNGCPNRVTINKQMFRYYTKYLRDKLYDAAMNGLVMNIPH
uniref:Uncharacterized protein n=1 Tax=Acrobeloides nanus TaxID=290746 RepID=A0A914C2I3_9BILA